MRYYLEETGLSSVESGFMIDSCKRVLLEQLGYNIIIGQQLEEQ
jgi:hypothetical protein